MYHAMNINGGVNVHPYTLQTLAICGSYWFHISATLPLGRQPECPPDMWFSEFHSGSENLKKNISCSFSESNNDFSKMYKEHSKK
jgi:hypothetical protein